MARSLEERGYVHIKNFFTEEEVAELQVVAKEVERNDSLIAVPEIKNPDQLCRVEDMLNHSERLRNLAENTVLEVIECLQGEEYTFFKDKLNFKWPGGGAFPPHQDFPAYSTFAPKYHVTALISVDSATLENGCLFVPENWRRDLNIAEQKTVLPYKKGGKDHGNITDEVSARMKWIPLTTTRRDLILFDSYVPHKSAVNESNNSRRAILITTNAAREGHHLNGYYHLKRADPQNPVFHFATPTNHASRDHGTIVTAAAKL
jgi:ectoine hydroxylase-related dioxygenase (phytanoyl-CoA dioxygenase family)